VCVRVDDDVSRVDDDVMGGVDDDVIAHILCPQPTVRGFLQRVHRGTELRIQHLRFVPGVNLCPEVSLVIGIPLLLLRHGFVHSVKLPFNLGDLLFITRFLLRFRDVVGWDAGAWERQQHTGQQALAQKPAQAPIMQRRP
jgi:hypothetical protein